jgi:hypothetical protein
MKWRGFDFIPIKLLSCLCLLVAIYYSLWQP